MPATETLSSTTLAVDCAASDTQIKVASTSGLAAGIHLYCDGELMRVVSLGVDPWVNVQRGVSASAARHHEPSATIYIGRADQFYEQDPSGSPHEVIPVSPYINTANGTVWFAQGDPLRGQYRWWQKQTATYSQGPLGVRVVTLDPTSST